MLKATVTISLSNIADNWRALDALSAPQVETAAVVKADAYGLGLAQVAPALQDAGAKSFFVAQVDEAIELRTLLGPNPTIYILSGYMPGAAPHLQAHNLIPVLNSPDHIRRFKTDIPAHPCALEIDSGMNRLGIEAVELTSEMMTLASLDLRLVMSHLACADEALHPMNAAQLGAFSTLSMPYMMKPRSLAATGGTLLGPTYHFNMTRPGIGLYGGEPFKDAKPVVNLALPVIQTRTVVPGEVVGYGGTFVAKRLSKIATVMGGYADGLIRAMGPKAALYAGSTRCPVVGRVSMDMITVDITDLDETPVALHILNATQTVDHLATAAGTIGYEILTSLGTRYERIYI